MKDLLSLSPPIINSFGTPKFAFERNTRGSWEWILKCEFYIRLSLLKWWGTIWTYSGISCCFLFILLLFPFPLHLTSRICFWLAAGCSMYPSPLICMLSHCLALASRATQEPLFLNFLFLALTFLCVFSHCFQAYPFCDSQSEGSMSDKLGLCVCSRYTPDLVILLTNQTVGRSARLVEHELTGNVTQDKHEIKHRFLPVLGGILL